MRRSPGVIAPARHVIHAVGPVWRGGGANERQLLANRYSTALNLARAHALVSIAFPPISTGVYRFPPDRAARIAVSRVRDDAGRGCAVPHVVYCRFSAESAAYHARAFAELGLT